MEAILLSIRVIVPVFILVGLGFLLKKIKVLNDGALSTMTSVTFKVFFPVMIFNNLYNATIEQALNLPVMLFSAAFVLISFGMAMLIVPRIVKENAKRSTLIQGLFRSNTLMLGVPVITALCGSSSAGLMTLVIAVVVPLYNALGVIVMEVYCGKRASWKNTILNILKNPLVVGSVLGIAALLIDFKLPYIIEKPIASVAGIAAPLALILLGGFIKFDTIKDSVKLIIIGVTGRLLIVPAVFLTAAILLGFRGVELATLMGVVCAPTAVSTFIMARQMKGDADLAAHLVVVGTTASAVSIFFWIFILKQLAMF